MRPRPERRRPPAGFTLVELGVVIMIIGLMTSLLLTVSYEGLRRSEERACQALIAKLDVAMADRVEALTSRRVPANDAHRFLAMTVVPTTNASGNPDFVYLDSPERALLIAKIDFIKRELPDVFFVQSDTNYPLNFAAPAFQPGTATPNPTAIANPIVPGTFANYINYVLPIGHTLNVNMWLDTTDSDMDGLKNDFVSLPNPGHWLGTNGSTSSPSGEGIFGASYQAMAALTRQLGYHPICYNYVDDDGDGLVDELDEGAAFANDVMLDPDGVPGSGDEVTRIQQINQRLANHTHVTARSEMLYAILIEGAGPLGSAFEPDDFTDREVADTDGDGLMEFVDPWGRPLQFYRWPLYHVSEYGLSQGLQRGSSQYQNKSAPRDQSPLDPNQLLVDPSWWCNLVPMAGGGTPPDDSSQMSNRANLFQQHFLSLVDPYSDPTNGGFPFATASVGGQLWDRTGFYKRRAYFFRHLILSAGRDRQYGVGNYGLVYSSGGQTDQGPTQATAATRDAISAQMILIENQAARTDPFARQSSSNMGMAGSNGLSGAGTVGTMGLYQLPQALSPQTTDYTPELTADWGVDDITSHTINATGTGVR